MKQILKLILLLVIGQTALAQAPSNYVNINGRYRWIAGMFDSTFHIPKGTSPSLRTGGSTNSGGLFYNTSDSSVYTYTGTQWIKLRGSLNPSDTTNKYVTQVYKKNGSDSVFYVKGGTHTWAFNDSTGSAGGGGGGKVYYFNGGVNMGTFGGLTMYELGDTANTGAAANFTRATTGAIANFITDPNKPGLLQIPAGVWTIDAWLSETGGGANHAQIWAVLEKWDGSTITTIATSPIEEITNGSTPDLYQWAISVPTTSIAVTDRIIIQFYITNTNGKTVTLYTQNGYVGEVHTTFTTGIGALNGLTAPAQYLVTGTSGTDFNISSVTATHTFNLPTASATNRGALSTTDWSTFNSKIGPSDTASMLSPYLRKADTTAMLNPYFRLAGVGLKNTGQTVYADTLLLSTRAWRQKGIDSVASLITGGYVPTSRTITINGTSQDLSANRTYNVGTVTSVATSSATGITGGTFTTSGTIAADTLLLSTRLWRQKGIDSVANLQRVTSVASGYGLSGGPITSSGTLLVDSATLSNYYLRRKDSLTSTNLLGYVTRKILSDTAAAIRSAAGSGTVTSVATNNGTGLTGGTITTSGTLAIDTLLISTRAWRQKGVDSVQANLTAGLATKVNISDTASMLTPYLRKIDTTAMLSPYLRSNVAAATYVPQSRTITINGTSQDLSANRTYSVGTVTSVATNTGTGITGGTITGSGTIAADTLLLSTRAWRQKGIDSVASLINTRVSGTTNYIPKFTSSSAIGNSQIFDNGTAVGIGTTTLTSGIPLTINVASGGNTNLAFQENASDKWYIRNITGSDAFSFYSVTGGSERMRITSGGNVVIGNTVASNVGLTIYGSNAATIYQTANTGTGAGTGFYVGHTGDISYIWNYNNYPTVFGTNNTERMRITSGGELLINTTSDAGDYKLQVNGSTLSTNYWTPVSAGNGYYLLNYNTSNASSRNWRIINDVNTYGDFGLQVATTQGGSTYTNSLILTSTTAEFVGSIKTAAPSGGTAKPWKLGEAGVSIGGSNLTAVKVEIDGTIYYLVTGYLPEPEPDPAALPSSGPSANYKTYNKPIPVKTTKDVEIENLKKELEELKQLIKNK